MARSFLLLSLLKEAHELDLNTSRRQAQTLRNLRLRNRSDEYVSIYRLSDDLIEDLENELRPLLATTKRKGRGLTNRSKILCALSFLANGSYQKILGKNINTYLSQPSVSRCIKEIVEALNHPNIVKKYLRFPQHASERQLLKERFKTYSSFSCPYPNSFGVGAACLLLPYFSILRHLIRHFLDLKLIININYKFYEKFHIPGVIGCIDGTFVAILRPHENEERYFCRKGFHARNVMLIVDADLNILHVDPSYGGATHDSFVFNNSIIKDHLEDLTNSGETVYLLGDSGYPQRSYLMTPVSSAGETTPEAYYNKLHATARNTVERAIGVLKARFRCLLVHRVLHYHPDTAAKIIVACCVLHNICNRAGLPAPILSEEEMRTERSSDQNSHHRISEMDSELLMGRNTRTNLISRLWQSRM